MAKEKVFIVVSHKHSLKNKRSKAENPNDWQVTETVEFVNQLRPRHTSMSSAIGDYINRKMITGTRFGITEYGPFEDYIRQKYAKELAELDAVYRKDQVAEVLTDPATEVFADQFGNIRAKTVFDPV
jgi:hypothetical protein